MQSVQRAVRVVFNPLALDEVFVWIPSGERRGDAVIFRCKQHMLDRLSPSAILDFVRPEDSDSDSTGSLHKTPLIYLSGDNTTSLSRVIMVTASCPLGCGLPQFGNYCGQVHSNLHLSSSQLEKECQSLLKEFEALSPKEVKLGIFGGEPLLRYREVGTAISQLKKSISGRAKLSVSVTTAGVGLSKQVYDHLISSGVTRFEVTIDGPREIHDQRRPFKEGTSTFDKILTNIKVICASYSEPNITIRCNVDTRNADFAMHFLESLNTEGVVPPCSFYVASIHNWGQKAGGDAYGDMEKFASLEVDVLCKLQDWGLSVDMLPRPLDRTCIAMSQNPSVVSPDGEAYFCTEVPLSSEKHGTSKSDFDKDQWLDLVQSGNIPCATCDLFEVCGGACPKSWLDGRVPCPSFKFNIDRRIISAAVRNYNSLSLIC